MGELTGTLSALWENVSFTANPIIFTLDEVTLDGGKPAGNTGRDDSDIEEGDAEYGRDGTVYNEEGQNECNGEAVAEHSEDSAEASEAQSRSSPPSHLSPTDGPQSNHSTLSPLSTPPSSLPTVVPDEIEALTP